jgi:hypothetical protein
MARMLWKFDVLRQPENEDWVETMKGFTLWQKPPLMTKFAIAKH